MIQDTQRGSEIFTEGEAEFFGASRRLATFNVNVSEPWFRYTWYLNDAEFSKLCSGGSAQSGGKKDIDHAGQLYAVAREIAPALKGLSEGRRVAKTLAAAFTKLRGWEDARAEAR